MKMTSAYANKMLKQLNEDKEYWVNQENSSCTYTAAVNEEPVVPEYDYAKVAKTIEELDEKIAKIKHAVNLANTGSRVQVGDRVMSVDTILIVMAQKNRRKNQLDYMRKQLPKTRRNASSYGSRMLQPEYIYINYDLELIKQEFLKVSEEILQMQMALDKYNQTEEFEVEI